LQPRAKRALHEIMRAETRAAAEREIARFTHEYGAKYPKAVASLTVDQARLLAFFLADGRARDGVQAVAGGRGALAKHRRARARCRWSVLA
jgi:hypothetical protein